MSERKYSVGEIQQMRMALEMIHMPAPMMPYVQSDLDARIERQLQTYLINGTEPEELTRVANQCMRRTMAALASQSVPGPKRHP